MFHVKHLSDSLTIYKALLEKYHKTLNLVSKAGLAQLDDKIADSLMYVHLLEHHKDALEVLDIGSGNGLPAIPMALALPHCTFHLVERRQRRASFLNIVKSHIKLSNVQVHGESVEQLMGLRVSTVTALAVGSLTTLYCMSSHLHSASVTLICRKGERFEQEISDLEVALSVEISRVQTIPLKTNGRLVAVQLAGGKMCRS